MEKNSKISVRKISNNGLKYKKSAKPWLKIVEKTQRLINKNLSNLMQTEKNQKLSRDPICYSQKRGT